SAAITRWRGRAADSEVREVVTKGHPLERLQPWLASELALAATTLKAADFQIDWRGMSNEVKLVPAVKLPLPVKVTKPAGSGAVRLTLMPCQSRPLVNGVLDPNQTLRLEKPLEIAANATDGDPVVLVPAQLPAPVYDLTIQAELLSADKRTALALAYAPVRRLEVQPPLVVRLEGSTRIETMLDAKTGATIKLQGQIERRPGVTSDAVLTPTGFPPGARADAVTVKAATTAFSLNVVLPANLQAGELTGLKLSGTVAVNPQQPNVRVRSREVDLTLVVRAPAK